MTFANEKEYTNFLEQNFFPKFFDGDWKPVLKQTKEKQIRHDSKRSRVDYFGFKMGVPTYVEVKNDRIRQRYLLQIVRYYCDCNEECFRIGKTDKNFNFYIICTHKIRPHRERILHNLEIKILDLKEVCSGGVDL